jgi:fructose-bisphosphate aldolase, class II
VKRFIKTGTLAIHMAFHSMTNVLHKAKQGRYGVGQFNFFNVETANAIIAAAQKLNSPVILAATEGAIEYAGIDNIVSIARNAEKNSTVPVILHLDHGKDIELIEKCIRKGFNSVMYDGSYLDFEKNIKNTRRVVEYAHQRHVAVEGELGQLKGIEDNASSAEHVYTNPDSAKEFVKRTHVNSLAIAIGTSHGAYKFMGSSKLRIDILKKIKGEVSIPLVLHGASSVPKELVRKADKFGAYMGSAKGVNDKSLAEAIRVGIQKVNTDTDLRIAWTANVREFLHNNPKVFDPRKINEPAIAAMSKVVEDKIKVLGSDSKGNI